MDDLVQWLRDQLAHDEAHARKDLWAAEKATASRWRARYGVNLDHSWIETESTPVVRLDGARHEADALLVARFQPETVRKRAEAKLADIEAGRRLLAAYCRGAPNDVIDVKYARGYANALGEAVRLFALRYADRPGYLEKWKP